MLYQIEVAQIIIGSIELELLDYASVWDPRIWNHFLTS